MEILGIKMLQTIDFKKYKRFFAFGCSFTHYIWPTWADLISKEIPESYNYGRAGGGNGFIFHSLIEASVRHKFNQDDLIIVQWTNCAREDRYVNGNWICVGNIYSQKIYPLEFINKFADDQGYFLRDLNFITATKEFLEYIKCDYDFLSMVPISQVNQYSKNKYVNLVKMNELYADIIQTIKPSYYEIIFNYNWYLEPTITTQINKNDKPISDPHPNPNRHLLYLQKVFPKIKFSNDTIKYAEDETLKLINMKVVTPESYSIYRENVNRF